MSHHHDSSVKSLKQMQPSLASYLVGSITFNQSLCSSKTHTVYHSSDELVNACSLTLEMFALLNAFWWVEKKHESRLRNVTLAKWSVFHDCHGALQAHGGCPWRSEDNSVKGQNTTHVSTDMQQNNVCHKYMRVIAFQFRSVNGFQTHDLFTSYIFRADGDFFFSDLCYALAQELIS